MCDGMEELGIVRMVRQFNTALKGFLRSIENISDINYEQLKFQSNNKVL